MFKFNLHPNEKLLKIHRQAEIILVKPLFIVFILIYLPWAFLIKYELHVRFSRLLLFWTLLVLVYAINKYLLWLINVYIITSQRLIYINYKHLIHKLVQETPIDRIQNISFEIKGFWHSLLKIGSVIVQVSNIAEPMVLKNLKEPGKIKDFLWQVRTK